MFATNFENILQAIADFDKFHPKGTTEYSNLEIIKNRTQEILKTVRTIRHPDKKPGQTEEKKGEGKEEKEEKKGLPPTDLKVNYPELVEEISTIELILKTVWPLIRALNTQVLSLHDVSSKSRNPDYKKALNKILHSMQGILHHLKTFKTEQKKLDVTTPFTSYLDLYAICKMLGGSYKPFRQGFSDPIVGSREYDPVTKKPLPYLGECAGHVFAWVKQIEKTGKSDLSYEDAYELQKEAKDYKVLNKREVLNLFATEAILEQLEPDKVYGLVIQTDYIQPTHIIGIRRVSKSSVIEIFDPNFGLFVFNTEFFWRESGTLKQDYSYVNQFLALLVKKNWVPTGVLLGLQLVNLGKQPSKATTAFTSDREPTLETLGFVVLNYIASVFRDLKKLEENKPRTSADLACQYHQVLVLFTEVNMYLTNFPDASIEKETDSAYFEDPLLKSMLTKDFTVIEDIILKIDAEKMRLKSLPNSDFKIKALTSLQEKIRNASPLLTLQTILYRWKNERQLVNGNYLSNREIMKMKSLPTEPEYYFIEDLASEHEVSPLRLSLLQKMIYEKIALLVNKDWKEISKSKKNPATINQIQIIVAQAKPIKHILREIQNLCEDSYASTPLGLFWHARSETVNQFYHLLRYAGSANPSTLLSLYSSLLTFEEKFPKASPSASSAGPRL